MNQEITFSSSAFIPLKSGMFSLSVVRLLLSQVGNQRYYLSRVSQALDCGGSYFFSLGRPQSTLFGRNAIIGSIEITLGPRLLSLLKLTGSSASGLLATASPIQVNHPTFSNYDSLLRDRRRYQSSSNLLTLPSKLGFSLHYILDFNKFLIGLFNMLTSLSHLANYA